MAQLQGLGPWTSPAFDADGALLTCGSVGLLRWPFSAAESESPTQDATAWRIGPPELLLPDLTEGKAVLSRDGRVIAISRKYKGGALVLHRGSPG